MRSVTGRKPLLRADINQTLLLESTPPQVALLRTSPDHYIFTLNDICKVQQMNTSNVLRKFAKPFFYSSWAPFSYLPQPHIANNFNLQMLYESTEHERQICFAIRCFAFRHLHDTMDVTRVDIEGTSMLH